MFSTLGCSTLSSLGIPVGAPRNRLLTSAKEISELPGQSILTQKELAIAPLPNYTVEISDTISVEPVSFDASIRLPGDQVVKPDGMISLGEFGNYMATGKTVEIIEAEVQAQIDQQIRSEMESEFAQAKADKEREELELKDVARLEFEEGPDSDENEGLEEDDSTVQLDSASDDVKEQRVRREFERRVTEKLKQNRISVRLTNWDSKRIYVLGEVNTPGSFIYIGNESVLDALLEAGGIGTKANRHSIIVSRPSTCGSCRTVMKVCYDQIVQLGDTSTNYQLLPGDRVFVPSMTFMDDLKQTFNPKANDVCPRCSGCDVGCDLPQGCE